MKIKLFLIIALSFFIKGISVKSQETVQLLNSLIQEDSAAITALALYPADVRKNILEVCAYPEALVRIEALQKNTKASFREALENYSKEEQQKIWDLSRYPGLISRLTEGGKRSKEEIEKISSDYPEEIREVAIEYGRNYYEVLTKIHALNINSDKAFDGVIKEYPEQAKASLRELLKRPEVIDILTSDMKMSVLVGDIYKKRPQLVQKKLDSISAEHASQNAKALEDWKAGLEKNPEAKKEMETASKEFVKEQGYDSDELIVTNEIVVVNHVIHPYPYWYGYPWWYDYPYWYPYPYWYDLGYYWGPVGIVYIGFPSPYFTHWFFYHPHHHYHYNHFSDYCVGHYYGPHRSATGFHREVSHWVKRNEMNVPRNFFASDSKRPDRIKEFGKFEMDYDKAIRNNPGKPIAREDFLRSNASAYPSVSPVLSEPRPARSKPAYESPKQSPVHETPTRSRPTPAEPRIQPKPNPRPVQPIPQPKPQPVPQRRVQPTPQSRPQQPKPKPQSVPQQRRGSARGTFPAESNILKDDFSRMNEAGNYHRFKWNGK